MSLDLALDAGLAALVVAVACWILAARESFAAVVGFVAYGLLLSLAWVRLAAVDVALTEAAIGGGATGVLLLAAAARLRPAEAGAAAERPGAVLRIAAAILSAWVSVGLAAIVLRLPDPAPTLAHEALASLPATQLGNAVTAVLLAYRAFDTLLETVVVLLALVGVWSLARDRHWGGRPGLLPVVQADGVLTFVAQVLPPLGIVVAIHLLWVGADAPGGKFQGATLLAAMWVLVLRAGLTDAPPVSRRWVRLVLVAGPAAFFAVGFAGFALAGSFLAYPPGFAKPLIVFIEAALMPSIAAALALLLASPPGRPEER